MPHLGYTRSKDDLLIYFARPSRIRDFEVRLLEAFLAKCNGITEAKELMSAPRNYKTCDYTELRHDICGRLTCSKLLVINFGKTYRKG